MIKSIRIYDLQSLHIANRSNKFVYCRVGVHWMLLNDCPRFTHVENRISGHCEGVDATIGQVFTCVRQINTMRVEGKIVRRQLIGMYLLAIVLTVVLKFDYLQEYTEESKLCPVNPTPKKTQLSDQLSSCIRCRSVCYMCIDSSQEAYTCCFAIVLG